MLMFDNITASNSEYVLEVNLGNIYINNVVVFLNVFMSVAVF